MSPSARKPRVEQGRLVVNGRTLSHAQARLWRMASDDLASGSAARVQRGELLLRRLEADLAADAAAADVRKGLDETTRLERARGERVDVARAGPERGRVRVTSRDGLESLAKSGAIDQAQHRAGLIYRDLYEATDPERGLRSHMDDLERRGRGGGPTTAGEAWAERRLRLAGGVAVIEAKVRAALRDDRALRALREVAGHARPISRLSAGGGAQAAYRSALIEALEVCVQHFDLRRR